MQITLRPQGRTFEAAPDETVLDAARRTGIVLPHGCRGGGCGSCRARLVAGQIAYPRGRGAGLSEIEATDGYVLLCRAFAVTDLVVEARELRRAREGAVEQLPCRIERLERRAPDLMVLWLRLPAIADFAFRAGQYLDILQGDGRRRSFSIASPPHDAGLIELHVRRSNEFTIAVFETLRPGVLLRIEGPFGAFTYREPPPELAPHPAILVAGGAGFAPLKSILRHVLETGVQRRLHLYWGARSAAELYDDAWLRERERRFPQFRYLPVLSQPAPGEAAAGWRTGLVHEAVLADWPDLARAEVYAAGPPALVEALRATLPAHGLAPERLYGE